MDGWGLCGGYIKHTTLPELRWAFNLNLVKTQIIKGYGQRERAKQGKANKSRLEVVCTGALIREFIKFCNCCANLATEITLGWFMNECKP
jgi:hypothetical protein